MCIPQEWRFPMRVSRRGLLLTGTGLAIHSHLSPAFGQDKEPERFVEVTKKSEESVNRGTAFLMKTIHRDGGCGIDVGQTPDIGCTAMVGLALLSQGNTPIEGPRSEEVRNITSFLMRAVDVMPSDDITSAQNTQLQRKIGRHAHSFFALLFLSQVLGEGWNPEPVLNAVTKLASTITGSQKSTGDWGGQSWAPTLGTVMGWVSLRGAHFAGLKVEASANKTADYLIKSMKNTVMVGSFTIDGDKESKQREERYEIKRVVKADRGDYWNIFARMKFGSVDATLPFPVEVKWAGSTPVITVDELKLIGMGDAFDARVLIADGKYAGTWSHGKVGGLMYGRIEKAEKPKTEKPKAEDTESE